MMTRYTVNKFRGALVGYEYFILDSQTDEEVQFTTEDGRTVWYTDDESEATIACERLNHKYHQTVKWSEVELWQLQVKRDVLQNYIDELDSQIENSEDDSELDIDYDEYDHNMNLLDELNTIIENRENDDG